MSEPDVVAELAWWLRLMAEDPEDRAGPITAHDMLKRAHDEIVALRTVLDIQKRLPDKIAVAVRDAALEEAVLACERRRDETGPQEAYAVLDAQSYTSACNACAFDIRALKART